MSESKFINLFKSGFVGIGRPSLEAARDAVWLDDPAWMGTVEIAAGDVLSWHPSPVTTGDSRTVAPIATSDLTDAEIREAREVIRVARMLKGGGA